MHPRCANLPSGVWEPFKDRSNDFMTEFFMKNMERGNCSSQALSYCITSGVDTLDLTKSKAFFVHNYNSTILTFKTFKLFFNCCDLFSFTVVFVILFNCNSHFLIVVTEWSDLFCFIIAFIVICCWVPRGPTLHKVVWCGHHVSIMHPSLHKVVGSGHHIITIHPTVHKVDRSGHHVNTSILAIKLGLLLLAIIHLVIQNWLSVLFSICSLARDLWEQWMESCISPRIKNTWLIVRLIVVIRMSFDRFNLCWER